MRWFMKLLIIAGIGWSGYWFIGANGQEKLLAGWLENSRDNGWIAETEDLNVTGFPNRFDTVISGLDLRGPRGNWQWQADGFQIFALSYQPNHIILAWPGEQVITNQFGSLTLLGEQLRGSIELAANTDLSLERLRIEATNLSAKSSLGWEGAAATANLALFQEAANEEQYRLGIDMSGVSIPEEYMEAVRQVGQNTDIISRVYASAFLNLEGEINRAALNNGVPNWSSVDVESVEINWGPATLSMSGRLLPARNGYLDGTLDFQVENWQILFAAFEQISLLPSVQLALIEKALIGVSQGDILDFSLRFQNGKTYIGPIKIGYAPINPFF